MYTYCIERKKNMKLTIKEILKITQGKLLCGDENKEIKTYSKDTRTIQKGDCYVGIKGETFDGNHYYEEAKKSGASACILEHFEGTIQDNETFPIILVEDSIKAIQRIAAYTREHLNIKVVAVTGSAGKTSTKDAIASVLSKKYKVLKTPGNLNGQIGLPFNILQYQDEEVLVLEMGMNERGQIDTLSKIAKPDIAVITNVGTAHIGILGSRENILSAKLEILNGMSPTGVLIYNGDNDMLKTIGELPQKKITFGLEETNDYRATNISLKNGVTTFQEQDNTYQIPVLGEVFVYNALASIAVARELGLSTEEIQEGLKNLEMTKDRMQLIHTSKYTILNDTYNANQEAMKSAIDTLSTFEGRKVAILGDMLELGEYEKEIHEQIGEYLNGKVDLLITIGEISKHINKKCNQENVHFTTKEEAMEELPNRLKEKDTILVKASHGLKLGEIVNFLQNELK